MNRLNWILTIFIAFSFTAGDAQVSGTQKFKNDLLYQINKTRAAGCNCGSQYMPSAPPLRWNDQLEGAALKHAKDMYKLSYFSHTSKDGRSMQDRVVSAGYNFKGFKSFLVGENIAAGQENINEVISGWFKSEGHCRNLMNRDFKEIGVAEFNNYWVQDFGARENFSEEEQKLIKSGKYKLVEKRIEQGH
jgi:uncharacterized protein YkwD